jgi:DNA modification methylase
VSVRILIGDCRKRLRELSDGSAHCCVCSPPYFGLRDYGVDGQMGLEPTPDEFVAGMVEVFREVRRVLRDDGTLWLNIGDSYAGARAGPQGETGQMADRSVAAARCRQASEEMIVRGKRDAKRWGGGNNRSGGEIKNKDMIGIPWMLAFALRADGWYLRQEIIWSKSNPMPESVGDRCTKAHEHVFLLSKSPRYHFDQDAILEDASPNTHARVSQDVANQIGSARAHAGGKTNGNMKAVLRSPKTVANAAGSRNNESFSNVVSGLVLPKRNKRSVWEVATQPFSEAHFATYPPALIEPCILAGCPKGGTVIDPFGGAGTTGLVADRLQRDAILIELNPEYAEIARKRIASEAGMFGEVLAA